MKLSYAQRLEDYHLELVFADVSSGFYVDVGGGHPVADNVSFYFYLKGWRGLVVEPQAVLAALYARLRPRDIVVDHPVGAADGDIAFHQVERLHGFSSIIEANAQGARAYGADYSSTRMKLARLSTLLDLHRPGQIDFLKIDVEGAEADVLAGLDLARHRPKLMCVEAVEPGSMAEMWHGWEPGLLAAGYRFAFFDELNRFYVADEHRALAQRFPSAPAPWNVVTHLYECGRADRDAGHPDRRLAERLVRGFLASLPQRSPDELWALLAASAGRDGLETGAALADLLHGSAHFPGEPSLPASPQGLDEQTLAALGRIAAAFDGGMIWED